MREEYATSYAKLDLPLPLPVGGDPDTELSTGPQEGLPIYASTPSAQEERMGAALRDRRGECALCAENFLAGENLMLCYHCAGAPVHVRCLADRMLREAGADESEVIPSEGKCWAPACARRLLWSRLVKGVQAYRPTASPSGAPEDEARGGGGGGGGASIGDGPLVWRVDDSSGDEEEEEDEEEGGDGDDSGDCDSEQSAAREDGGGGGWSSGAASRNLVSNADRGGEKEVEEEDDDDDDDDGFWDLGDGRSQVKRTGGLGGSGQARRGPPCVGGSARVRGRKTSASLAVGREGVEKPPSCDGQHVSLVESASERYDSDSNSSRGGGGDPDRDAERSPPRLPLAERLRLRRLRLGGT